VPRCSADPIARGIIYGRELSRPKLDRSTAGRLLIPGSPLHWTFDSLSSKWSVPVEAACELVYRNEGLRLPVRLGARVGATRKFNLSCHRPPTHVGGTMCSDSDRTSDVPNPSRQLRYRQRRDRGLEDDQWHSVRQATGPVAQAPRKARPRAPAHVSRRAALSSPRRDATLPGK
jgi:hypothetical protein